MALYEYHCPACGWITTKRRQMSRREAPLPCQECGENCSPVISDIGLVTWGTAAAAHGAFVEETRPGYHGITKVPRAGSRTTGTREELMSR